MAVDPWHGAGRLTYQGIEYCFCTSVLGQALGLVGDHDPHGQVDQDAGPSEHGQDDKENSNQRWVEAEELGEAATDAGQLSVGSAAVQLAGWVHDNASLEIGRWCRRPP
jgi:hypothetical protein